MIIIQPKIQILRSPFKLSSTDVENPLFRESPKLSEIFRIKNIDDETIPRVTDNSSLSPKG
ncbi:hypothetical protein [Microcoleus sp. A006_D1]|uniref:hypothetical protein n=1 Tax=Microcoleus sp. A006_D1 TaxID=3055267 RepID=UPI002FD2FDD4